MIGAIKVQSAVGLDYWTSEGKKKKKTIRHNNKKKKRTTQTTQTTHITTDEHLRAAEALRRVEYGRQPAATSSLIGRKTRTRCCVVR